MSNAKWKKLLPHLVDHKIKVKIKLLWHEERGENIIIAHTSEGNEIPLDWQVIFSPALGYYEGSNIGPFKPSDIEWLELAMNDYKNLFEYLDIHLEKKIHKNLVRIYGYKIIKDIFKN